MRLMSGNAFFTVGQLAEKLSVSCRSIYRYIDTFKSLGFTVEKIHGNVYRLVRMPSPVKDLQKLVYFSDEEAKILCNLIENLDGTNNHLDVWAYDVEKRNNCIFKIPRIDWVDVLPAGGEHEEEQHRKEIDAFRMAYDGDGVPIRLELPLRAKNLLVEEFPLAETSWSSPPAVTLPAPERSSATIPSTLMSLPIRRWKTLKTL